MSLHQTPTTRALQVDFEADGVAGAVISHGQMGAQIASLHFLTRDNVEGRVTFEKLDAFRVCRGEYSPYELPDDSPFSWISIVENSPWLRERYYYESEHYRDAYEFGGDVDEMLRDYNHYLFLFNDEFVEAIAAGIWIDLVTDPQKWAEISSDYPLCPLPASTIVDRLLAHDLTCQVRKNPLSPEQLVKNARLCSQPLLDFKIEGYGGVSVTWRLSLRVRNGRLISQLRSDFGNVEAEFEGVADLAAVRPHLEDRMRKLRDSQRARGM